MHAGHQPKPAPPTQAPTRRYRPSAASQPTARSSARAKRPPLAGSSTAAGKTSLESRCRRTLPRDSQDVPHRRQSFEQVGSLFSPETVQARFSTHCALSQPDFLNDRTVTMRQTPHVALSGTQFVEPFHRARQFVDHADNHPFRTHHCHLSARTRDSEQSGSSTN
jgi:hypothetical protein